MTFKKGNALIVWDRCGDYHIARWRNLSDKKVFKKVFLANLGNSDNLYKWQSSDNEIISLSDKPIESSDLISRVKKFLKLLAKHQVDYVILAGYGRLEYLLFILISSLRSKKVILFAESWYDSNAFSRFLKRVFLKTFVSGLFVSGERARQHFRGDIGLRSMSIETGYSAVDNNHFADQKKNYNLEILCVARYSPEKNLFKLISAFRKSKAYNDYRLILVGDGPQKESLAEEVKKDEGRIVLTSWKTYKELPNYYHKAKYFILPSIFEPWGLVVNEAMAAGKPVIISNQCGCLPDFLNGKFGFVFDPNNELDLIKSINDAVSLDVVQYERQSEYMRKQIAKFDLNNWSKQLKKVVDKC